MPRLKFHDDTDPVIQDLVRRGNRAGSTAFWPCACCDYRRLWMLSAYKWKDDDDMNPEHMSYGACYRHLNAVLQHINQTVNVRVSTERF